MNPTQTAKFRFGPVRQEAGAKHVRQGDLLEAINVRQTAKAGVYAKRKAFARTAQTFVGGALSGTPETVLPGQSGNSLMRDTGDQLWARSAANNEWSLMGTHLRYWPEVTTVASNLYTTPQPFSCVVGMSLWVFALTSRGYDLTILDAASGVITGTRESIVASGIVHASAAYDGSYVWLFWVDGLANGTVRCHKIDPAAPTAAPVVTAYYRFPTTPTDNSTTCLQQVQARYLSASNQVIVVSCGGDALSINNNRAAVHSVLNPATGTASASQVTMAYAGTKTGTSFVIGGLYILDGQDGSDTYWYYTYSYWDSSTSSKTVLVKVTTAAISTNTKVDVGAVGSLSASSVFIVAGYCDTASDQFLVVTTRSNVAGDPTIGGNWPCASVWYKVHLGAVTGGPGSVFVNYNDFRNSWIASGFTKVSGTWYALTGYDDWTQYSVAMGDEGSSIQRAFHLRKFAADAVFSAQKTAPIVAQFSVGNGPALGHRNSGAFSFPTTSQVATCVPPAHMIGTNLTSVVTLQGGSISYVDVAVCNISTTKVYGKSCQAMGYGFSPGNIPVVWRESDPMREIRPLLDPEYIVVPSGGAGSDFSIAAAVFVIYGSDGTVWRSSPKILSAPIGSGVGLSIASPKFIYGSNVTVFTEVYLGNNGTPKLQTVLPPGSSMSLTYVTPTAANMVNGEILYTTGNALSATWPIPCQAMGAWGNRIFAAQENVLWTSKELEPGFGPLFSEVQTSPWNEERNDITAIAPVDWNYLGIASSSQVAVINGPGPDGVGNGNYVIKTLPSYTGVAAGGIALQGPQGMYYQNPGTGRIMCLQPSLQVMEAAGGAYDYAAYAFTVAAWYESENLMVFFAPASGAAIAIDYQHPQDVAPFGQVYLWTFAAGFMPAAACRDDFGLLVVSSQGGVYRTTTSQWVDDNNSGTTDTYQMKLASAELQLVDLQGSFNLKTVQALLTMRGASGVSIGVYPGYASATAVDSRITTTSIDLPAPVNSGDTESIMTKPVNCMRIQSFRVAIQEKPGITTQSFEFEGLGVEFSTMGRLLRPASGRVI